MLFTFILSFTFISMLFTVLILHLLCVLPILFINHYITVILSFLVMLFIVLYYFIYYAFIVLLSSLYLLLYL